MINQVRHFCDLVESKGHQVWEVTRLRGLRGRHSHNHYILSILLGGVGAFGVQNIFLDPRVAIFGFTFK